VGGGRSRKAKAGKAGGGQDLPALLKRLDSWLAEHRKEYHAGLRPGASPAKLKALEKALGRALPDELRTWLGWHDGQDPAVMGAFVEDFLLLGTEEVPESKEEMDEEGSGQEDWIPFLDDGQGDYVCLEAGEKEKGAVREVWRGQDEAEVVAPDLTTWVAGLLADFEAGKYHEDPERGGFHKES
jgi:cell wall assembly regulator SMI1